MSTLQIVFDDGYDALELENVKRQFLDHRGFMHIETECGNTELTVNMEKVKYVVRDT